MVNSNFKRPALPTGDYRFWLQPNDAQKRILKNKNSQNLNTITLNTKKKVKMTFKIPIWVKKLQDKFVSRFHCLRHW